jgi:hypothetical protein
MTLTIDSAPIDLPPQPQESFQSYLDRVADFLLQTRRCIGRFRIDGQEVATLEEGGRRFPAAATFEVESVSLQVALQANVATQCEALRKIQADSESLITDSLLSDPRQVAASWNTLCEEIKKVLAFVPVLNGLLTDKQVDSLVDGQLANLTTIMNEIRAVMAKADVVAFSDLLEMKLVPWIAGMREFFEGQRTFVASLDNK